jgi:hypothetical protein
VSGRSQCAQIRPELGVYVLGAITPADRARVSRHLASCPGCREEVAGLARLPALLRKVPAATVMQLSGDRPDDPSGPPEPRLDGLIGRVAAVRRRWRWSLAAAAAVLAAPRPRGGRRRCCTVPRAVPRRVELMGGGRGVQRGHRGSRDGALLAAALGDRARGQRQRHPARHPLPDLGYHHQRAPSTRRQLDRHPRRPACVVPRLRAVPGRQPDRLSASPSTARSWWRSRCAPARHPMRRERPFCRRNLTTTRLAMHKLARIT